MGSNWFGWFRTIFGIFAVIGALNWGSVGLFNYNPIHSLSGTSRNVERGIYGLVGLSGVLFALSLLQPFGWFSSSTTYNTSSFGSQTSPSGGQGSLSSQDYRPGSDLYGS